MNNKQTSNVIQFPDPTEDEQPRTFLVTESVCNIAEEEHISRLMDTIAHELHSCDYLQSTVSDSRLCSAMIWTLIRNEDGSTMLLSRADQNSEPWAKIRIDGSGFPVGTVEIFASTTGAGWRFRLPHES